MVHTYSLIHDDLPAMDDDDYRRGQLSCHKRFGEATAILAGDALLTLAFEVIAACRSFPADRLMPVAARLARALGTREGMIAGQVLDLQAEGQPIEGVDVEAIHRAKTAALISTSVWIGAFLGGAADSSLTTISQYGQKIGLAFQIVDDILDETETRQTLGKTAGKDREENKATYPALHGLERSREIVRSLTDGARQDAEELGSRAELLRDISAYLERRCS
jgi:geranylgeranyl diphosphate synthase type II